MDGTECVELAGRGRYASRATVTAAPACSGRSWEGVLSRAGGIFTEPQQSGLHMVPCPAGPQQHSCGSGAALWQASATAGTSSPASQVASATTVAAFLIHKMNDRRSAGRQGL